MRNRDVEGVQKVAKMANWFCIFKIKNLETMFLITQLECKHHPENQMLLQLLSKIITNFIELQESLILMPWRNLAKNFQKIKSDFFVICPWILIFKSLTNKSCYVRKCYLCMTIWPNRRSSSCKPFFNVEIKFFCKEYLNGRQSFTHKFFWKLIQNIISFQYTFLNCILDMHAPYACILVMHA